MDLLQKNRRMQCLNVVMEIESMIVLMNDLPMECLEPLKQDKKNHFGSFGT